MSRKRDVHAEERALWSEVTRDVRRLRGKTVSGGAPGEKLPSRGRKEAPAKPKGRVVRTVSAGLDGATAERLKRGKVRPDAVLDLHGLKQSEAYARLAAFVSENFSRERRCLLVITGKGSSAGDQPWALGHPPKAGVLRSNVPRWLEAESLRAMVAGIQTANVKHGGTGALYVYLRRKRGRQ